MVRKLITGILVFIVINLFESKIITLLHSQKSKNVI